MFYMSVHDLVWANALLEGDGVPFDYELLEEAIAAQYGYGDSTDALGQAADFVRAIAVAKPFERGNLRTALLALGVYLEGNGRSVRFSGEDIRAALLDLVQENGDPSRLVELMLDEGTPTALRRAPVVTSDEQKVMNRATVLSMLERARPVLDSLVPHDIPITDRHFDTHLHRD